MNATEMTITASMAPLHDTTPRTYRLAIKRHPHEAVDSHHHRHGLTVVDHEIALFHSVETCQISGKM